MTDAQHWQDLVERFVADKRESTIHFGSIAGEDDHRSPSRFQAEVQPRSIRRTDCSFCKEGKHLREGLTHTPYRAFDVPDVDEP